MHPTVDPDRIAPLNPHPPRPGGCVVYWMSRDQRANDNWALLHAQEQALAARVPLAVVFVLNPAYPSATADPFAFMLAGLCETAAALAARAIPFVLLTGDPPGVLPAALRRLDAGLLVTDFDPLRHKRAWAVAVARALPFACLQVDAHNVVPCQAVSDHAEIGARTLRPKIHRLLPRFLTPFPPLRRHPYAFAAAPPAPDFDAACRRCTGGATQDLSWAPPGSAAALRRLTTFVRGDLARYAAASNDPNADAPSRLSPYLHFGQLSAQRLALTVQAAAEAPAEARERFLEQSIVRRELADNFCWYQPDYDRPAAAPAWAARSIAAHARDPRPYLYDRPRLEAADTHDPLWNAAQRQLASSGYLHGFLRMYWAKKILEWSPDNATALDVTLALNDRYFLDGRDPNGYTNVAWSILGVHDRPWPQRPVYGALRCMTLSGCRGKFDVDRFVAAHAPTRPRATAPGRTR